MRYKKSNIEMKQKVSDMLSVLPCEMDEIREREQVMLEKERIIEGKKLENDKIATKRDFIVLDARKGLDIHVPMAEGIDFTKLQGLINIDVHLHQK